MRRLSFVPLLLSLAAAPAPAAAQTGDQPTLVLSLFGGVATGHSLWQVSRQPLAVLAGSGGAFKPTGQYDTLDLNREIGSSLILGASATYYRSPHVGFQGEVYFLGLPIDDTCRGLFFNSDSEKKNEQTCANLTAASASTSAIAFFGSVILRAAPGRSISPYLRVGGGLVTYSGGTVEMSGTFGLTDGSIYSQAVIEDPRPKTNSLSAQVGVGITAALNRGYQFRFEVRDAIIPLQVVTGPADINTLRAPRVSRTFHHIGLTLGLDVVLEKKRGRRY